MTERDELLDRRVHDAYESIELSDEAQDRMLANLLAAQQRKMETGSPVADGDTLQEPPTSDLVDAGTQWEPGPAQAPQGKVVRVRWIPMAIAATVIGAVVAGGFAWSILSSSSEPTESVMYANETEMPNLVEEDASSAKDGTSADVPHFSGRDMKDEDVAADTAADPTVRERAEYNSPGSDDSQQESVHKYPLITLEDGTKYQVVQNGVIAGEVDAAEVGELVGAAMAADDSYEGTVACKVYRVKNASEVFAVRYDGEESYWYCEPLD